MTGGEPVLLHQLGHRGGEIQQPEGIGDGAAGLAHTLGRLLLGHVIRLDEGSEAGGLLHGVQIFPLEVFNQGQLHDLAVVRLDDQHRHLVQTGLPGGAPAALTGDDLVVAGGQAADGDGLENAVGGDALRQIAQSVRVKLLSGLGGVGLHLGDGQGGDAAALALLQQGGGAAAHQGVQTPAQAGLAFFCHRVTLPLLVDCFT